MILASDLIELIDISTKSISEVGGWEGLIEARFFSSGARIKALLRFMQGYIIIDMVVDGFFEDFASNGFAEEQYYAILDYGLMEYAEEPYSPDIGEQESDAYRPETIGRFKLTALGDEILRAIENQSI